MPSVQEQEQDLAGAYPVCCQAALPRAGVDEHRSADVHQTVWSVASLDDGNLRGDYDIRLNQNSDVI